MSDVQAEKVEEQRWWQRVPEGKPLLLGLVKIDRQGSTREWQELSADDVLRRRARYTAGVEQVARDFDAAQPLLWQGDGVMLCFARPGEPAAVLARHIYRAARALWERVCLELNLPARIAVHAALVPWSANTGTIAHPAFDLCGHLEHAAPVSAVVLSEDVYLALSVEERRELGGLGSTIRDGMPAYVFPANAAQRRDEAHVRGGDELGLWDAFRRYTEGPDVRLLRYVGLRLQRKEPPSLDVRDVFVMPGVEVRRRGGAEEMMAAAWLEHLGTAPGQERPDAPPPWEHLFDAMDMAVSRSFEEVFRERRSLIVLGDPGSGKTTLLRWLAVSAAGGLLTLAALGVAERLLPLPISVGQLVEVRREMGTSASVVDAMARYFHGRNLGEEPALRSFLQERLNARQCLVLLDSLDEMRNEERHEMLSWIETFASAHAGNRFVASSRRVGYAGLIFPDSEELVLRPFSDEQIERYVRAFHHAYQRWELGGEDPSGAEKESERFLETLKGSPRLGGLDRNPFLLSALALIHRAEGRLPRHRVQVYDIFAQALCETWGKTRRLATGGGEEGAIDYEVEAIPILGEFGLRMHEQSPGGVEPRRFVLRTLEKALLHQQTLDKKAAAKVAEGFLQQCGEEVQILLERGPDQWGFLHLTFQEFFAAVGLHAQEKFEREAMKHLFDPRWKEVIRLGLGYLAFVQKRPEAARRFMAKALRMRAPEEGPRSKEVSEKLSGMRKGLRFRKPPTTPEQ